MYLDGQYYEAWSNVQSTCFRITPTNTLSPSPVTHYLFAKLSLNYPTNNANIVPTLADVTVVLRHRTKLFPNPMSCCKTPYFPYQKKSSGEHLLSILSCRLSRGLLHL